MNLLLYKRSLLAVLLFFSIHTAIAQTDIDAIMMSKDQFCTGLMLGKSSWNKYWEGTNFRENLNLGTVSSNQFSVMGNYGLRDNINILFNAPYIANKASAGVLRSVAGLQDFSTWIKWMPIEKDLKLGTFSAYFMGGASLPMTDYVVDYLPLTIGLKTATISGRFMLDYQVDNFFITGSETYTIRGYSEIERNSYYTTQQIYSNKVAMPAVNNINLRAGYRSYWLIAEAVLNDSRTLGGFDITKNNMPFPSNRMNATTVGVNFKYEIEKVSGLSLIAGGNHVIQGRNVGQTTQYYGGVFYILDFSKKNKSATVPTTPQN
jgi:hypothetical protein